MITSNIDPVIERTQRLPQRITRAMQVASAPIAWQDEARAVALRVLQALARPDQIELARAFVKTVTSSVLSADRSGFVLTMRAPPSELRGALASAQAAYAVTSPIERAQGSLFSQSITRVEELILEWVQTPEEAGGKARDARDWGKTDEEIAHLISYIMLGHVGTKGHAARTALLPHIEAFIHQKLAEQHLDPQTADEWLRAVLAAWREWVRERWLTRVREELRKP